MTPGPPLANLVWTFEPNVEGLPELLAQIASGSLAGDLVKENPTRRVVHATTAAGEVFVKTYFQRGIFERLKHVFVASKARSEYDAMRRLRAAGVSTAEPLAMGERRLGPFLEASAFVARAVPGARAFARELDALRAAPETAERRRRIDELAELAHAIAKAGADHRDLHVGNVLVDAAGRLTIIDLHAVSFPAHLAVGRRFERLARLALSLGVGHEERAVADMARDEVAWLAARSSSLDPQLGDAASLERRLAARALELLARHLLSRDRRCVVDSKGFAVEGTRGRRVYRLRDAPAAAIEAALAAPVLETIHRHSRGRSVLERIDALDLAAVAGSPQLVRKREEHPGLWSRLGALFRGTRARRAWLAARALTIRGLPSPRALALVEERTLGFLPRRSFLLLEHVAATTMVHLYVTRSPPPAAARRQELARAVGRLVARLHARGLVHRDLAVQNILVRERPDPESRFDLWLVDLDEVRVRAPDERLAVRALELADLPPAATRSDKLRGLRAYLAEGPAPALQDLVARSGERALVARIIHDLAARAAAKSRRAQRRPAPKEDSHGLRPAVAEAARLPQDEGARPPAPAPDR